MGQIPDPGQQPASAASFRDPAGRLVSIDGRVIRTVSRSGAAELRAFLASAAARNLLAAGRIAGTEIQDAASARALLESVSMQGLLETSGVSLVVEHERIAFPSYPYEWPPEMLHAAAGLTLDLALELLPEGFGLKDATPYNVLFRGPEPVFIDLLSFERRDPDDPTWLPYAQFVRTFLLPLLAARHFGLPLEQVLTTRRDGLEPEEVYRWLSPFQKIRPPFLSLVTLPTLLARRSDQNAPSLYRKRAARDPEKARFILEHLLRGLRRRLERLRPGPGPRSAWSDYMASHSYSAEQFAAKRAFVERVLSEFSPKRVLDAGCNTGHFSVLAARAGAAVVAIDADPAVVGEVWRAARHQRLNILPLAVSLTRPSPATGWRNRECPSFLDRARGAFDCVLMLAVIHHMLVSERVPLPEILDAAAELTTGLLLIEFIGPEDPMFRRLTRGREALHEDLNAAVFESACRARFDVLRDERLEGAHRRLYLLRKRGPR